MPQLPPEAFTRYDGEPDDRFYIQPRFVTHIDDSAIRAVTQLYREYFPPGGAIWQSLDDKGHARLVESYLQATSVFTDVATHNRTPRRWGSDPLYAMIGRRKGEGCCRGTASVATLRAPTDYNKRETGPTQTCPW